MLLERRFRDFYSELLFILAA